MSSKNNKKNEKSEKIKKEKLSQAKEKGYETDLYEDCHKGYKSTPQYINASKAYFQFMFPGADGRPSPILEGPLPSLTIQ
jgi:hypothetical protein